MSKEVEPENCDLHSADRALRQGLLDTHHGSLLPESYRVTVEGPDRSGEITHNDLYLEKEDFDRTQIGDIYECGEVKQCAINSGS